MTGLSKKLLLCFCLCFGLTSAKAQYRFDQWTTDNGLPQNSVYEIAQTRDGYLWLATADGLARFDGVRFQIFNRSNSPGIVNNRFICLFEDAQGDLWAGTEESGAARLHGGHFTNYGAGEGVTASVYHIVGDAGGNATVRGDGMEMIRFADGKFSSAAAANSLATAPTVNDWRRGRSVNLLCLNEVDDPDFNRCFVNDRWTRFLFAGDGSPALNGARDADGKIWLIDTSEHRLFLAENERAVPVDAKNLPGESLRFVTGAGLHLISRDERGALWLTDLHSMKSELLLRRETADETTFSEADIESAISDDEDNFWFGMMRGGLFRARKKVVAALSKAEGLRETNVYPIYQDNSAGAILVGTMHGLFNFQNGVFKLVEATEKFWITAIGEDADGRLLFADYGVLNILENDRFARFSPAEISTVGIINAIHADRERQLWVGGANGLMRFADGVLTKFTVAEGLAGDDVRVIVEARAGGLWVGTYGGLTRVENERLTSWTESDGLPSRTIRALYEDSDGTLWIGSYDSGLARFKNGKFTRYDARIGLSNDGAFQILEDDNRQFWISSNRGIYRVSKDELNEFADGKRASIASIAYNKSDGMLSAECNGGRSPAGIKTRNGEFWFPTQDGVAIINPAAIKTNPKPPPVVIESVKFDNIEQPLSECGMRNADCGMDSRNGTNPQLNDELNPQSAFRIPQSSGADITINPNQQNFEIRYTALSFVNSENLRFKYRLEGLDTDWVDAGTRRTAYFSHVAPGKYTFHVIAANSDGVWNMTGKSLKIVVQPPFYRTWWFTALSVFLIGAVGFLLYRRRIAQVESRNAAHEEFSRRLINAHEAERSRVAAELHDSIGQTLAMIKNRAAFGSQMTDNAAATEQLEAIRAQAAQAIGEVREISYNLRPYLLENLGLTRAIKSLVHKIEEVHLLTIDAQISDVDDLFSAEAEMSVYRIVQESLNNVAKHSEVDAAALTIDRTDELVTIEIEDDGRGFDRNAPPKTDAGNGGFGLLGIAERVRMLGGSLDIQTGKGKGVKLTIRIVVNGK